MTAPAPFSILECAVAMHEMFTSYVEAGFTESQALYLVGIVLQRPVNES